MRLRRTLLSGVTTLATALCLLAAAPAGQHPATDAAAATLAPRPLPVTAPPGLAAQPAGGARSLAVTGSGPICWYGSCYDYVNGRQVTDAKGATIRMLQAAPEIKPGDVESHSLQELALQSADQKSTVEIGWTVDLGLNGDTRPHLFVYHWVDGQESCYNGCGFVQVSRSIKPGMAVRTGSAARFSIVNVRGDWWLFYDEQAVGYFPGSLWGGTYQRAQIISAFGEVAHAAGATCEDMGTGRAGTARGAGWIEDFGVYDSHDRAQLTVTATSPALYSAGDVTRTGFHLGGAGSGRC
ncbi:hypothetical protein GCM10009665_66590 [Kitasatospora nipponensis]|uniref:Neprosin PEP catalytic domain-containing protein n=1 Tax=Kitasatospora nipponensis TaxID=258049 RepID=A0ABP4HIN3_9ACTN